MFIFEEFTMKKLVSALVSAAFIATPMVVISTPAAAQSVTPTATSSFKIEAKRSGKKAGKSGKSKSKKAV